MRVVYAIMPWAGVMMLGYVYGKVYRSYFDGTERRRILRITGFSLIALFLVLRAFNIYGDPVPWSIQRNGVFTILSFLNVSKYPPSLLYLCVTLGPGLLLLSAIEHTKNRLTNLLKVYGNVPLFYYILHWYLLRILSVGAFYLSGYGSKDIVNPRLMFMFRPESMGYSLGGVYLVWLLVISTLYFPCRWFGRYKRTHQQWWLSYL